jgi:hypothetical protein
MVPMAIMVVAVVAAGIVQEAEGVVVMVIIPVRRAGAKITAAAIGVGSRATELVTFEANNPWWRKNNRPTQPKRRSPHFSLQNMCPPTAAATQARVWMIVA